jgi:hypothetical protein
MSEKSEATPTTGLPKSASVKPTARSMARLGARLGPPVVVKLFRWLESTIAFPRRIGFDSPSHSWA